MHTQRCSLQIMTAILSVTQQSLQSMTKDCDFHSVARLLVTDVDQRLALDIALCIPHKLLNGLHQERCRVVCTVR